MKFLGQWGYTASDLAALSIRHKIIVGVIYGILVLAMPSYLYVSDQLGDLDQRLLRQQPSVPNQQTGETFPVRAKGRTVYATAEDAKLDDDLSTALTGLIVLMSALFAVTFLILRSSQRRIPH